MSAGRPRAALSRPALHAGMGLCGLLLAVLPPAGAITCAALGILVGWVVFPLTALERYLRREGEPFLGGLRTYPVAVFGLVVLLPPAEAAAAWAVLAYGDTAAAVVGTRIAAPPILRLRKATWSGTAAYLLVGGFTAWGMAAAVGALGHAAGVVDPGPVPGIASAFLAAAAAVLVDVLLRLPDDNLPCAAVAGAVLYAARGLL